MARLRHLALLGVVLAACAASLSGAASAALVVPDGGVAVAGSTAEVAREIDAARAVGLRWTSHSTSWESLEPTPDGYLTPGGPGSAAWAALEEQLAYAKSQGMSVELRFSNAPAWASGRSGVSNDPPTPANNAAYGEFLADVGRRLGPYIDAYSPWNEPNISNFWAPVDAGAYVALQKVAYRSIKSVEPDATVLSAPIVGLYRGYRYLTAAYEAGLRGSADVIGWNAYPLGPPEEPYREAGGVPAASSLPGQLYLRDLIDRYDPGRRVWVMELSWSNCVDCTGFERNAATEAQQADYLRRTYAYRRQYLTGVTDRIFWFGMRDRGVDRRNWETNQGLLRADFSPKPAYAAMRDVAVEVAEPDPSRPGAAPPREGPPGDRGRETPRAEAGGLPAAAARSPRPRALRRGRRSVSIGPARVVRSRGYLVLTGRIAVRGGTTRVRVEGYRGRWRPVATLTLRRTSRIRVRFVDRAYLGVRLQARIAGRPPLRVARVVRIAAGSPVRAGR